MPSSESAAPLSRARGSAATQSSSFQSELRDDTDPPNVQATAAIIDDQATTAGHRRRPHISDKAKGDGRTDPQKADSDMTTMTIMFTMLAAYFYLLNEKTSREHGAFDTLDSCHSGASTAHDLCHQIWDSQPRPRSTASSSGASTTHGSCRRAWGPRPRSTASSSGASTTHGSCRRARGPRPRPTASISRAPTSMTDHYSTASMPGASTKHGPCHGSWGPRTRSTASVSGASTDLKRYPVPSDEKTDAGTTNEN